jgi:hypothetical protein
MSPLWGSASRPNISQGLRPGLLYFALPGLVIESFTISTYPTFLVLATILPGMVRLLHIFTPQRLPTVISICVSLGKTTS